jgi:hypothetical protein
MLTCDFLLLLIVIILAGCGGDDDTLEEGDPVANFVSTDPPCGDALWALSARWRYPCDISPDTTITVTFDNPPTNVTVSTGTVTVTGKKATIVGPFPYGVLALTITWRDGTQRLIYTVPRPDCC